MLLRPSLAKTATTFLVALVFTGLLCGQSNLASITGAVSDTSQAAMPGVTITIKNTETGLSRTVQSNAEGYYTITNLAPGPYELTAEMEGFRTFKETGIVLEVAQVLRDDIVMELGQVTESVTVSETIAPIETERGAITGDVIVYDEIQEIPLEGRDFTDLAFFVPGVLPKAEGGQGSAMNINGARATNTNFYVDGFNNRNARGAAAQIRPNIDALQEFKMQVSGYSAEYGRFAGGILNMALRSGTNNFHGSLFYYLRNDIFDARTFFAQDKEKLRRHQMGATVGGPIVKNKTFFLVSYEGYRQILGQTRLGHTPTEAERNGDFSQSVDFLGRPIYLKDPFKKGPCKAGKTKACFPGNIIPPSRLNPIGLNIVQYYPLPNRADPRNNYIVSANDEDNWNSILAKVDHRLTDNDTISWRYQMRLADTENPFAGGSDLGIFGMTQDDDRSLMGLNWTHLFSPTVIMELRGGYSRNHTDQRGNFQGQNIAAELGLPELVSDPELMDWPKIYVLDHFQLGTGASEPVQYAVTDIQEGATFTWVKSKHVIKAGFDGSRVRFNQPYFNNQRGTFRFLGRWTGAPIGDLLLGLLNNATRQVGFTRNYWRQSSYGWFLADDFKVTRNLTLNLGVRYEINKPPVDRYDRLGNFVPELGKIVISDDKTVPNLQELEELTGMEGKVVTAAEAGLPRSMVYTDYTNIAPRLGIAWRPFGSTRTVIRTGYGLFYGAEILNPIRNQLANNFPFALRQNFPRLTKDPTLVTLENPFPEERLRVTGVNNATGYDIHAPTAYLQSWNFTIERELWPSTALEVGYVGSKGTHLGRRYDINQPVRSMELYEAYQAGLTDQMFPRPIPDLNAINFFSFGSNSIYNSFQISLRRRSRGGFFYRLNYIFSKSLDEASQFTGSSQGGFPNALDSRNLWLDRGRSDFDRGHVFSAVFSYELPVGRGKRYALRGVPEVLFGGWQLSGTARMYSGPPFTVRTADTELNLGESLRPNRIFKGTMPENAYPGQKKGVDYPWYDLSAFEAVPCIDEEDAGRSCGTSQYGFTPFAFGNSGRNILDGPGLATIALGLRKNFRFKEQRSLQVRIDVFNILNHTNFLLPDNYFNRITGGYITRVGSSGRQGGPRVFQFGLRYRF